jgi:hypothetical protein
MIKSRIRKIGHAARMTDIIIDIIITFMQSIYNYIPATNHVSTVHSVAAIL